jgi:hypothetical protein
VKGLQNCFDTKAWIPIMGAVCIFIVITPLTGGTIVAFNITVESPSPATILYSWVHLTDTQTLSASYPLTLNATFSYIESLKTAYNVQRIIVTGDLVDAWNNMKQWSNYVKAETLTTIKIDNVAGNHDWYCPKGGYNLTNYYHYTNESNLYYDEVLGNFIFIFINYKSFNATGEDWLRNLLSSNPDRIPVFCLHIFYRKPPNVNNTKSPVGYSIVNVTGASINIVLQGHYTGDWALSMSEAGKSFYEFNTDWQDKNRAYIRLFQVYSNYTVVVNLIRIFDIDYPVGSPCIVSSFTIPLPRSTSG